MKSFFAFISGLIFGLGILLSGMINPTKVLSFLDITRIWDPSLAIVMAAAVAVGLLAFSWGKLRESALLGGAIQWPTARGIDSRLIGGSALFGIGWGIAGICPGPGVVLLGVGSPKGYIFVAAMAMGALIYQEIEKRRAGSRTKKR